MSHESRSATAFAIALIAAPFFILLCAVFGASVLIVPSPCVAHGVIVLAADALEAP